MPATELENQPARPSALDPAIAARLRRSADGLVAAIVREHDTGDVLMLAWMDDEALHRTLTTGRATYWSRSRREYWVKGATSGHHQYVRAVALDCDGDALLVTVDQVGAACHTGTHTCFSDDLPTSKPAETGPPAAKGAAAKGTATNGAATNGAVKSGAANGGAGEGA
nr:phosphoribosyl-AMP cyclohydrolase [Pseudosporangium ferrugineum]